MDKHSQEYKRYRAEISRKHRANHADKVKARVAGKTLAKEPCELCLLQDITNMTTEAHHDDYKKPWQVRWLCKKHHEQVDTELARRKNG